MNFPLSTPSLKALILALQTNTQKQDKAAQEILKRVQNWEKMLAQLDRDNWSWLDSILNKQVITLTAELQSGQTVSYYIANGQFATGFAVVQGLIRAEISNKRKELEKFAEARAKQSVVEAEKVSATFAKIPML